MCLCVWLYHRHGRGFRLFLQTSIGVQVTQQGQLLDKWEIIIIKNNNPTVSPDKEKKTVAWHCLSKESPCSVSQCPPSFFILKFFLPTVLYQLPHPIPSPLSSSLLIVRVLLGAYQAHRTMFPSNRAFILSLPWQLPISPRESLGDVFPWRWHGDIAKPLWTACWDRELFLTPCFPPLPFSLPIILLFLWQQPPTPTPHTHLHTPTSTHTSQELQTLWG